MRRPKRDNLPRYFYALQKKLLLKSFFLGIFRQLLINRI